MKGCGTLWVLSKYTFLSFSNKVIVDQIYLVSLSKWKSSFTENWMETSIQPR